MLTLQRTGYSIRAFVLLAPAILFSFAVPAQDTIADKYAGSIRSLDLKKTLEVIASPEMEGRETGTEGMNKAAAYIADRFESGRVPSYNTIPRRGQRAQDMNTYF